jgi:small subunit ribosomal protein S7
VSRRKTAVKRTILPDARYDSQTVSKFINVLMYQGKKSTAERIFYNAMDLVENRTGQPGVNVIKQALSNLNPVVEVKSRRVGGAT